jgi:dTDP-4-amino-4,6-dideoxygalactose transaminase
LIKLGLIGYGYWGPNLARNFTKQYACQLKTVADIDDRHLALAHREPAYHEYCRGLRLPITEDVSDNSLLLPLYVPMADGDVQMVIDKVKSFLL